MPPPQRLILRPTDLSRLRIDVALKLRRRAAPQIRMQLLALSRRLDPNRLLGPGIRSRRLVDLRLRLGRGGGCRGCGVGGGGGGFGCAEGARARFLQLLEYLLLFCGCKTSVLNENVPSSGPALHEQSRPSTIHSSHSLNVRSH